MGNYCLVFQLQNPEHLLAVFGENLMAAVERDLTRDFTDLAERLLERHTLLGDIRVPVPGLWYQAFSLKRQAWPGSDQEQRRSLAAAAGALVREALLKNFGPATGSRLRVKTAILPLPEEEMPAAVFDRLVPRLLAEAPDQRPREGLPSRTDPAATSGDSLKNRLLMNSKP